MKLPKELTDSILQGVVEKVMDEITPGDDTPDDDDGILGVVKRGISPDQDKDSGVMNVMMSALSGSGGGGLADILGGLLGGGQQEPEPQPASQQQQSSGGGLMDILGGLLGGGKKEPEPQPAPQQQQSSGGGLMDILGGLLGGGQKESEPQPAPQQKQSSGGGLMDILGALLGGGAQTQRAAAAKDNGLLGTITDAIGGEGVVGDLLESVLRGKNITASNLAENPSLMDKVKDIVVELLKDFVVDKVKASLISNRTQGQGLNLNKIIDLLTPDN